MAETENIINSIYIGPMDTAIVPIEETGSPKQTKSRYIKQFYCPGSDMTDYGDMVSYYMNVKSKKRIETILASLGKTWEYSEYSYELTNMESIIIVLNEGVNKSNILTTLHPDETEIEYVLKKIDENGKNHQLIIEPPRACFSQNYGKDFDSNQSMNPNYLVFLNYLCEVIDNISKSNNIQSVQINEKGKPALDNIVLYKINDKPKKTESSEKTYKISLVPI